MDDKPAASPITYRGVVHTWQCDHMGHMNVMWYTGKFDEASWNLLAMLGLHRSGFSQDGTAMAGAEQHIHYKRELYAGDTISIESELLEVNDKSIRMLHKMMLDASGEVAATSMLVAVHIDARTRKAIRLSDGVRQRATQMQEQAVAVLQEMWE
jgi:acyl-CoA thioester hydrolase